jgi:hypothetical protein
MFASSRRRIVVRCFEDEKFQGSNEERAVRVAFRWRKASVPNHLLPMLYYKNTSALIGTWRTTQENSATTRHMAQDIWLCLGQLIRNLSVWYALPERG